MSQLDEICLCLIASDADIVMARQFGRRMAEDLGFSRSDQALIATAISELARNILTYAISGTLEIKRVDRGKKIGLQVIAADQGPGITDIELAMTEGFSTGKSLGLGLSGTRRIADFFNIESDPGNGLKVTIIKWKQGQQEQESRWPPETAY